MADYDAALRSGEVAKVQAWIAAHTSATADVEAVTRMLVDGLVPLYVNGTATPEFTIAVAEAAVAAMRALPRGGAVSTAAIDTVAVRARELLSSAYEGAGELAKAARALADMPIEAGLPSAAVGFKAELWTNLASLYLRLDDTDAAERYLNQARPLFAPSAAAGAGAGGADAISASTRARFGIALAQQLDATRKFPEAAQRFLAVARSLDDEQGVHALRGAAICALMSGPSRLRAAVLQALGADERLPRLGDLEVAVLKARDERVLRADDLAAIRPHLQRHHLARNSQHRTLFDVAVVQHNALSASRLYANVSFTDLGAMLGLDPDEAESVVASMAAEGRLAATLDQVRQIVVFPAARPAVARWDAQIEEAGRELTACAEAIARQFPELIPAGGL